MNYVLTRFFIFTIISSLQRAKDARDSYILTSKQSSQLFDKVIM